VRHLLTSALIAVFLSLPASGVVAVEFAAHRALYHLVLEKARSGSGITGVSGRMAVEWQDSCTGWTFEYHSVIDVEFSETKSIRLTSTATSWESRDGSNYRFSVRHKTNGTEVESIEGVAKSSRRRGGSVEFSKPKARRILLPKGTLFPIAHSLAVMKAGSGGKTPAFLSQTVFDGMDVKGLYQVNAAIGLSGKAKGGYQTQDKALKKLKSWHVNMGYFALESKKAEPDHEIKMRLYANGVADDMLMDFDEFIIRARLDKLDVTPRRVCR
jgi:hypothetical protein